MTARHQIRVGGRRLGRDRSPIDATRAPTVGEMLQAAREKKGVDLYRAERDTKIRARHLAALEGGDYEELPGSVYTKGFLRNYALYLGLDPEDVLVRWRDEQDIGRKGEVVTVVAPPQPITEPRRGLTFTPGLIAAALLTVVVLLFGGYVGLQLVRWSQAPLLTLDGKSLQDLPQHATSVTLRGTAAPHMTINVTDGAGKLVKSAIAADDGHWAVELAVTKGRNDFSFVAHDQETGKDSEPQPVIINVQVPATPSPRPTPSPPGFPGASPGVGVEPGATDGLGPAPSDGSTRAAAQLSVTSPDDGARSNGPHVTVAGATDASNVRVTAAWAGSGAGPRPPGPTNLAAHSGSFAGTLTLAPGPWTITLATVQNASLVSTSARRSVDVSYGGLAVEVGAAGGSAWIQVWMDGVLKESGHTFRRGEDELFMAKRSVVIHTGNAGATVVSVQGEPYGALGSAGAVGSWIIEKGKDPRPYP